jgi:FAD dependent oxidoreductase TIGR03364
MTTTKRTAIVVGAGIVGIAAARALAIRGFRVQVFEKNTKAVGASIRNFGMVWPIGQPVGYLYERAMRSRRIWEELSVKAGLWHDPAGSLQVAYERDEMQVLEEFNDLYYGARSCRLLTAAEALSKSPILKKDRLLGAFYSADEMTVDPREAIAALPDFLSGQYDIKFHFGTAVTGIEGASVTAGAEKYTADKVIVCGGQEFESLYPEVFQQSPVTKCKLQMMRSEALPAAQKTGPAICGGLTLSHYASFKDCPSLQQLRQRIEEQYPEYVQWGIHVMLAQNGQHELVIGDSHEYGPVHDPFDKQVVNQLILDYLAGFTDIPGLKIAQTWNGTYLKMTQGTELVISPEENVTIVNGLGGAGMSLSFGLLEEVVADLEV